MICSIKTKKEQLIIDKEIEKYIKNKEIISGIKKGLTNLSLHLQRYKPSQWNTFFQLAMDIKPKKKNVIIKRNSKRIIPKEQSKSKERYNTLEDIKKYL